MEVAITIPGAGFATGAEELRQELMNRRKDDTADLPISRIFDFIRLTPQNQKSQRKLIRRGTFERVSPERFRNRSRRSFSERLKDIGPNLDSVVLSISRTLTLDATISNTGELLTLVIVPGESTVLVAFDEPPSPGFGRSFVVEKIEARLNSWTYRMVSEFDPDQVVNVVVDMTVEAIVRFAPQTNFRSLSAPALILRPSVIEPIEPTAAARVRGLRAGCKCECCSTFRPRPFPCPEPNVPLRLTLRCVVVADNNAANLQNLFQQHLGFSQQLFANQLDTTLQDGGTNTFNDPTRSTFPPLTTDDRLTTEAQDLLDRYLPATVPNTITCLYVTSMVGNTAGLAQVNNVENPWLIVELGANNVTLSHEIGHVLGLNHVPVSQRDNLMHEAATRDGLQADQIATMRCSPLNERV